MAAFLTIEMVKECLKKFYEAKGSTLPSPLPPEIANKVINLDCNFNLLPGWEQCLDMKTGEIYFINQKTGTRIDNQPHTTPGRSYYIWKNSDESNEKFIALAAPNPLPIGEVVEANSLVLVVCKRCIEYMIIAKYTKDCPRCGGTLVDFTNERCF